jgi:hypothetical protein
MGDAALIKKLGIKPGQPGSLRRGSAVEVRAGGYSGRCRWYYRAR